MGQNFTEPPLFTGHIQNQQRSDPVRLQNRVLPDPVLVERLHAGVPVVCLPNKLQVLLVGPVQIGPQLVPFSAGLLQRLPGRQDGSEPGQNRVQVGQPGPATSGAYCRCWISVL